MEHVHEGAEEPTEKVYDELVVKVCLITPDLAAQWLEANYRNRPLRERGSDAYGRDAEGGKWVLTGDTIKFDWFGRLVDGQHRLTAVVKSGRSIESLVVWGVDPEARKFTDTGMARLFRDVLLMDGVEHSDILAPAVRRVALWNNGERVDFKRDKVTPAEHEETLEKHPELIHCVQFAASLTLNGIRVSRSLLAFMYWVLLHANPEEAEEFMTRVGTGANLPDGDPILRLRTWVSEYGRRDRRFDIEFVWKAAVTWNAWMEGRTLKKVQLPRGGIQQDNFPTLRTTRKERKAA